MAPITVFMVAKLVRFVTCLERLITYTHMILREVVLLDHLPI